MERDFLAFMPHTVGVQPRTGITDDGRPTYGATTEYRARIVGKGIALRRTSGGYELSNLMTVYLDSTDNILPDAKLSLPTEFSGSGIPEIFTVNHYTDESGVHHLVLQCGWSYHGQRSY